MNPASARRSRGPSWIGPAALVGLVLLAIIVAAGLVRAFDVAALDAAQLVPESRALDVLASLVSLAGRAEITGGIALGWAVARWRAGRRDAWVPLAIALTVVVEAALKLVVPQVPPPHERSRTVELIPFLSVPFVYSFPSGHVARAVFLLVVARVPLAAGAVAVALVAVTRLYLAEHWATDVAGGLLLGYGVAWFGLRAARRLG